MQRRTFLAAATAPLAIPAAKAEDSPRRDIYELRTYAVKAAKAAAFDEYVEKALLPAANRHGLGPVGSFLETDSTERPIGTRQTTPTPPAKGIERRHILLVHQSAESAISLPAKLAQDGAYQAAAQPFLAATPADAVYTQHRTTLLTAISGMPKLEAPDATKPRILNLRTYRSHNDRAAAKKVEMFEKGELAIFRRTGLAPVFFASALAGPDLPHLTYMLAFPDDAAREAAWKRFVADPEWKKLSQTAGYADAEILTVIVNRILTPRPYSGI
jgi:hypothetical protein